MIPATSNRLAALLLSLALVAGCRCRETGAEPGEAQRPAEIAKNVRSVEAEMDLLERIEWYGKAAELVQDIGKVASIAMKIRSALKILDAVGGGIAEVAKTVAAEYFSGVALGRLGDLDVVVDLKRRVELLQRFPSELRDAFFGATGNASASSLERLVRVAAGGKELLRPLCEALATIRDTVGRWGAGLVLLEVKLAVCATFSCRTARKVVAFAGGMARGVQGLLAGYHDRVARDQADLGRLAAIAAGGR